MSFAKGLRAILRQDPDVILIGEIRDTETAKIATQASLTGHLVLSTLHTNTATGAVTRLQDMGIETFMLASSLLAVISQRLVRKLCVYCRSPHQFQFSDLHEANNGLISGFKAVGCEQCNFIGYRGRTAIHELLIVDESIRNCIYRRGSEIELEKLARKITVGIKNSGIVKITQGMTTLEEVIRVTRENIDDHI